MAATSSEPILETLPEDLHAGWVYAHPPEGEEVVISGISGRYPESDDVPTFAEKLYNKVDLITADDRRWSVKHPEIPENIGKINKIEKFDASFFGIHYKQAHCMDPIVRIFLEKTVEAIFDAGMSLEEIRGTRTGVICGISFSESEKTWFYEKLQPHGFALTGCARSVFANRVSYFLGVQGPSYSMDTACSSSGYALDYAYKAIRDGLIDTAIVGGGNLCLHPYVSLQFARLGVLNPDGKCKVFDENANGYTRSEACIITVLQKAKNARRIYATVVHSKANCDGYKEEGITFPSGALQKTLISEFYKECNKSPEILNYMEAHGTGTKVGDPEEIKALESSLLPERTKPLYIGSVKSNIGHTEPASLLCSLTKVIIGMEYGYIPPNINLTNIKQELKPLVDGRMIPVTEKTKWDGGYAAINNFGFGGGNAHVLLKQNEKVKVNHGLPKDDLPRLVCLSGRNLEGVNCIFDDIESRPLDAEYVKLLEEAYKYNVSGHYHRGYAIFSKPIKTLARKIAFYDDQPKPIWYIFSGLGSQWLGMGTSLLKIPAFAETIEKCQKALAGLQINLQNLLTRKDPKVFEDNINITVSLTAMQIGLVDLLKKVRVEPTNMIGCSIGDLACAYADGALTLEQAILCSYHLGLASKSKTPEKDMLSNLKKIIPSPKERSSVWIATTDNVELAKKCSAEYIVHTLSCSTAFQKPIPKNAVVIEIAPQSHLLNLLKNTIDPKTVLVSLMEKDTDNVQMFLEGVGELYLNGSNPLIGNIYPEIQFPVSRSTPMINHLIKWDHHDDWFVTHFESQEKIKSGERTVTVLLSDDEMEYIAGHVIDGRVLFPATGYLNLVWETVGMMRGELYTDMSIVFENVKFLRATNVPKEGRIYLMVMVQKVSGNFEVIESGQPVVTGTMRIPENVEDEVINLPILVAPKQDEYVGLTEKDIYKELRLRGYGYGGKFRGLTSCDVTATVGEIKWKGNYVSFMDTMLQMQILQEDTRGLFVPTHLCKVVIDAFKHKKIITNLEEGGQIPCYFYKDTTTILSGGISFRGLNASAISRRKPLGDPVLETYKFIPNITENLTLEESMRVIVQLAFENIQNIKVKTVELIENIFENTSLLSKNIQEVLGDLPLIQADINVFSTNEMEEMTGISVADKKLSSETDSCLLVTVSNVLERPQVLSNALGALVPGGFLICRESKSLDLSKIDLKQVEVILQHIFDGEQIIVVRKTIALKIKTAIDLTNGTNNLDWLPALQSAVKSDPNTVIYAQGDELNGIIGFVNCLRKEPGGDNFRCVFIMDKDAPKFDFNNQFYENQLKKGLGINILKGGVWGTYRHLLLPQQGVVKVEHAYVNVTVRGDLSSLKWLQGNLHSEIKLRSNQMLVQVYYSALNFRDIMTATGRLAPEVVAKGRFQQECVQGLEFAGRLPNGRRVMGMVACGGLSTMVVAEPDFVWDVPDNFSMEDAVTVPVVYGTVFYAMLMEGKMKPGESILIHAGSGGIGQAAINIALHYGLKVYTTVGTQEKREFIKATWPQIKDNQIGNSRDLSFEQLIMTETNGRGVDLVLNSLAEEKLQASVRCLAKGGRFLEIGKFDLANDNPLPLTVFYREASYHGIMLDTLFYAPGDLKRKLWNGLQKCIADGAVKPLTRTVFKEDEIEEAFRFMATGKHMGKVLIKIREEEKELRALPTKRYIEAIPRYIADPNGSYIIAGGLGGFGLELADWLVLRGARYLVLTSRKGISSGYQSIRVKLWRSYGVEVHISTQDITTFEGCKGLIEEASKMAPVVALFNLAVILQDAIFDNQTKETYETSFGPKPVATKYFDELTRRLCPELKVFVVFSSVSCGRGNAGQTNYGMGNSVMERIVEKRQRDGYPGLAIEWGAVGDVGLVADMQEKDEELEIAGTLLQKISNCLHCMDQFLRQPDPIVSSMVVAEKRSTAGAGGNVIEAVVNILGIRDIKTVSFHSSLAELGMDSIMAVEIKQTLEREFEVFLSAQDIRSLTFARLQEIASEKEAGEPVATKEYAEKTGDYTQIDIDIMLRTVGEEQTSKEKLRILKSQSNGKDKAVLIPGIEGVATIMEPLAKNIKMEVSALQIGFENDTEDIETLARAFLPLALKQLPNDNTFNLIGYSYGSAICLEIAALLEKQGRIGNIVLIDGSPFMIQKVIKQKIITETEDQFQNNVLNVIVNVCLPREDNTEIVKAFSKCNTWEDKLDSIIGNAPSNIGHTEKHLRNVCNSIYQRLKSVALYENNIGVLKSKIKLIKPTQHTIIYGSEDFELSTVCENPIEIVYVDGNHETILQNIECANEINKTFLNEVTFKESIVNPDKIETRNHPTLA